MLHPHTRLCFVSDTVGMGVVATEFIPKGTVIWVRDELDCVKSTPQVQAMPELLAQQFRYYSYLRDDGHWMLTWDHARFMNHSCLPNCVGLDDDCEIAVADIQAGDQLTNNYALFNLDVSEEFACQCGARTCRAWVKSTGESDTMQESAALYQEALEASWQVMQPLSELFSGNAFLARHFSG